LSMHLAALFSKRNSRGICACYENMVHQGSSKS
jgi:hypothetical protein